MSLVSNRLRILLRENSLYEESSIVNDGSHRASDRDLWQFLPMNSEDMDY